MGLVVYSAYAIGGKEVDIVLHGKTVTVWCSVKANASLFFSKEEKTIKHWCSYVDKVLSPDSAFSLDPNVKHVFVYLTPEISDVQRKELYDREKAKLASLDTKYAQLVDTKPSVYSLSDLLLDASASGHEEVRDDAPILID